MSAGDSCVLNLIMLVQKNRPRLVQQPIEYSTLSNEYGFINICTENISWGNDSCISTR